MAFSCSVNVCISQFAFLRPILSVDLNAPPALISDDHLILLIFEVILHYCCYCSKGQMSDDLPPILTPTCTTCTHCFPIGIMEWWKLIKDAWTCVCFKLQQKGLFSSNDNSLLKVSLMVGYRNLKLLHAIIYTYIYIYWIPSTL